MLYYLFEFLDQRYDVPGAQVFQFISFRTAMAVLVSLTISLLFGKKLISMLQRQQVKESIRNLGLEGQMSKQGTPTMGGIIILAAILVPTLLFAELTNIYIILMLVSTVWLGAIGFMDDYIKVFKKNKEGLAGRFKILGQIGIGVIVGATMFFHPDIVVFENVPKSDLAAVQAAEQENIIAIENLEDTTGKNYRLSIKSTKTTIPFVKGNEFDYEVLLGWLGDNADSFTWLLYILVVTFIITAVSNGVNLTDGLDGLAAGLTAIVFAILAIFAYVSGNTIFSEYLNIMYLPNMGEVVIFSGAAIGACVGFLWFNTFPARVFMGDTGSLALGGLIAVMAIVVRKELLIPLMCGIFLVENLSVIIQVAYFKYTKKKYGEGRRIFLMSPLHHHYQKKGYHEAQIVVRFWIVGVFLALLTIITLKLR